MKKKRIHHQTYSTSILSQQIWKCKGQETKNKIINNKKEIKERKG